MTGNGGARPLVDADRQKRADAIVRNLARTLQADQATHRTYTANQGGWGATVQRSTTDDESTVWAIAFLKLASERGIQLPEQVFGDAEQTLLRSQHSDGGFAFSGENEEMHPWEKSPSNKVSTALALAYFGSKEVRRQELVDGAANFLAAHPLETNQNDYYLKCWYIARAAATVKSTAMTDMLTHVQDQLIEKQTKDGSIRPIGPGLGADLRDLQTAEAILAWCAPYVKAHGF